MLSEFYKEHTKDQIWWVDELNEYGEPLIGRHLFSFDKNKVYNLFQDYPYKLTPKEKEVFDKENPYWADYFKDRTITN